MVIVDSTAVATYSTCPMVRSLFPLALLIPFQRGLTLWRAIWRKVENVRPFSSWFVLAGRLVYHAASVGIVLDTQSNKQVRSGWKHLSSSVQLRWNR